MSEASDPTSANPDTETTSPPENEESSAGGNREKGLQQALAAERQQRQALAAKLAEIEAAQKKAAEEAAAKRGEFEQLYGTAKTELEAAQARLAEFEAAEKARTERLTAANAEALKALPEGLRVLVPEGLSPEQTAEQIQRVQAMVADAPRGGVFGGGNNTPKADDKIPAEHAERANREAARYNMDPQAYWKVRLKPRLLKEGKLKA